jgi:CelD/BcsL family acetyltransferase involved in cellulose biosynthesis
MIKKYLTSTRPEMKGLLISSVPDANCPYLVIDRSFEDYLKSFSPKKRQTLLRKRRILMDREKATLKTVDCGEEPEEYFRELFALHDARAKQKRIKTTFRGEDLYKFHTKAIRYLLKSGKVILTFLYKESNPLASYYCVKHNNKYYYYQAGLSDEGEKKSAGTVLFSLIIENAFKERCKEFDLLRGSEEYKFYWTKNYRKDYSITVRKDDLFNIMVHYNYAIYRRTLDQFRSIYKPGKTNMKPEGGRTECIENVRS